MRNSTKVVAQVSAKGQAQPGGLIRCFLGRTQLMTSRRTRIASTLLGVILWGGGTLLLTACGAPNAPAFTNTEQTYLSAVHNPCQHPEVFTNVRQGDTSYCEFVWAG